MKLISRQPQTIALLALAIVLAASVFGRPDIPIDETRYVSVAWEMWASGDWLDFLVPHKNGLPYHHKPPLLFWLINAGWAVFGVNDWWPRAISAIFSLLCLPLTAAIAFRLWPHMQGVGERARWLLLGGAYWLFFSTAVIFDIMLTAFVLMALLFALRAAEGKQGQWWGVGLAFGLGILAKGPVMLLHALPVLLLAPWWAGFGLQRGRWFRGVIKATVLGAFFALLWAVPAAMFGGEEFRNAIFWGQTAGRVSGSLAHKQPFWFYLATLPVLLFPMFFWAAGWRALAMALRERSEGRSGVRFCLAWILPAFIVFSLAGGKQVHYLIPLLPAIALLVAFGLGRLWPAGWRSALPPAVVIAALGFAFILHPLWSQKLWLAPYVGASWQLGGFLLLGLAALTLVWMQGESAPGRMAVLSVFIVTVFTLCIVRPLSPVFDTAPMAQRLKILEQQGVPVANVAAYNDQFHFYGRLHRPLQEIPKEGVADWFAKNPQGRAIVYVKRAGDVTELRPEFSQAYLEGAVALIDSSALPRLKP